MNARTLIIGDVHGCSAELSALIERFGPIAGKDRLVQVGDLINKGPDTLGCVRIAEQWGMQCVLGNHEAKLLAIAEKAMSACTPKEFAFWGRMGSDPQAVVQFVRKMPLWLDLPQCLVVHAGLEPGKNTLKEMSKRVLISIRTWDGQGVELDRPSDPAWYDCIRWPKTVVFGHWALRGLVDRPDVKGLDTGCVYGGRLTGWCPEEDRFYFVQAQREYVPMQAQ